MTKFKPLNILIVGGGMYVCGRGTDNFGTILPAVLEAKKKDILIKFFYLQHPHNPLKLLVSNLLF